MEKNKINESNSELEQEYENYINKSIETFHKYNEYIKLTGKILHYLSKPVLYYNCLVHISNNLLLVYYTIQYNYLVFGSLQQLCLTALWEHIFSFVFHHLLVSAAYLFPSNILLIAFASKEADY